MLKWSLWSRRFAQKSQSALRSAPAALTGRAGALASLVVRLGLEQHSQQRAAMRWNGAVVSLKSRTRAARSPWAGHAGRKSSLQLLAGTALGSACPRHWATRTPASKTRQQRRACSIWLETGFEHLADLLSSVVSYCRQACKMARHSVCGLQDGLRDGLWPARWPARWPLCRDGLWPARWPVAGLESALDAYPLALALRRSAVIDMELP